jgi:hypothetical protein
MCHVDRLPGNDREIRNYTTAVTMQWAINSNRGTVFSVWSVPICQKQDRLWMSRRIAGVQSVWDIAVKRHGDSSGTHRKLNVRHCKPLPSNGHGKMTFIGYYIVRLRSFRSVLNPYLIGWPLHHPVELSFRIHISLYCCVCDEVSGRVRLLLLSARSSALPRLCTMEWQNDRGNW